MHYQIKQFTFEETTVRVVLLSQKAIEAFNGMVEIELKKSSLPEFISLLEKRLA